MCIIHIKGVLHKLSNDSILWFPQQLVTSSTNYPGYGGGRMCRSINALFLPYECCLSVDYAIGGSF